MTVGLPKSRVNAVGVLIDGTQSNVSEGKQGFGLSVLGGATASLSALRLSSNHTAALAVLEPGTLLELSNLLVDNTQPRQMDGRLGVGVDVYTGSALKMTGARITSNRSVGLRAQGEGSVVEAFDLLLDGTLAQENNGLLGMGVMVSDGASTALTRCRISGNRIAGLVAQNVGTRVSGRHVLIDGTMLGKTEKTEGVGVAALSGAAIALDGARVSGNVVAGVFARSAGTRLDLKGALIDATKAHPTSGHMGVGVLVNHDALIRLDGAVLTHNRQASLVADGLNGAKTTLKIAGAQIRHTHTLPLVVPGGEPPLQTYGVGLLAMAGVTSVHVLSSLLRDNHGAAMAFDESSGSIAGSVVTRTHPATYKRRIVSSEGKVTGTPIELSDGLVALAPKMLRVSQSVFHQQVRAGLLLNKPEDAQVSACLVTGGLFGIALESAQKAGLSGNLLHGNGTNIASDEGLFVPAAPEVVGPSISTD